MNTWAKAGLDMLIYGLGGLGIGWALNNWLHWGVWLIIAGFSLGVVAGGYRFFKITRP
jgi:hypothetical protein